MTSQGHPSEYGGHEHPYQQDLPPSQEGPLSAYPPAHAALSDAGSAIAHSHHPLEPASAVGLPGHHDYPQPPGPPSHRSSSSAASVLASASGHLGPSPVPAGSPPSSDVADVLSSFRVKQSAGQDAAASCDRCRRRKIKCDKAKPACGTCSRLAVNCRYSDVLRKRGPPTKREKQVLASLGLTFTPERKRVDNVASSSRVPGIPAAPRSEMGATRPGRHTAVNRHPYHPLSRPAAAFKDPVPVPQAMLPPPPPAAQIPPAIDPNAQTQSVEVPGSASSVRDLLEKSNALMPIGGGSDQATAAVLQTRFSSILGFEGADQDDDKPSRVYAVGGDGRVRLTPLHSYPKRVAEVFAHQSSMSDLAYLQSIGIDPTDAASLRAGIARLVAHPAAAQMHHYIKLFGNRAPSVVEHIIWDTFSKVQRGESDDLSLEQMALAVTVASLAGSDCLPLPLDGGKAYAAIPEFATACYKVAVEIAMPRHGAALVPPDPLEALQLHSWLCTASAYTDKPIEGMIFWSQSSWAIVKQHGMHHTKTDPRKRTETCTGAELRAELTVRAVWGLVIVSNFSALLAPGMPPPIAEEITASYPRSIFPLEWTVDQIPDRHFSPEGFDAWVEYIRIHHVLQRMSISVLAKGIWDDVEDRARRYIAASCGAVSPEVARDPHAAPEPWRSSVWIQATNAAVAARHSLVEGFTRDLMAIASDCHAFKAHAAQPKLNTGQTDMHGWLYVVQHALQIYAVCQERLTAAAADIEQARFSLMAMSCPLPPSVATQSFYGDEDAISLSSSQAGAAYGYVPAAESVYTAESGETQCSLGAQSVPVLSAPGGAPRGHRYQYGYGYEPSYIDGQAGAQEAVPAGGDPPPLAALRSREKLNSRIADWISQVPRSEIPAFMVGDLSQMG